MPARRPITTPSVRPRRAARGRMAPVADAQNLGRGPLPKAASGKRAVGGAGAGWGGESSSEARLRAILDSAVDAIITIDARGLIQGVNAATVRMFGFGADELVGRNVKVLMPSPYREEHDGYLADYLRTGEKRIIGIGREVRARRKDGSVFAVDLAVSEVEPGRLFTGIIRDISDRKLAEARVRQADRMASIGTLAAGLGHDMNNVLLPVRARLNALRAAGLAGRIPGADRKHVDEIRKSISYLQQLADGLHFLAMDPEKRHAAEREATTDLKVWWSQTGPLISKAVPKHVRVTASIPGGLPAVAVAAHGLTQAVLNLVVNAGDAIPAGRKRREGRIRVWAREAGGPRRRVEVGVTDNGAGMSDEVQRRAFELFYTTKPRGLGTGLGLPLVRTVAEQAGGSVAIESVAGKGTTVVMTLSTADDERRRPRHDAAGKLAAVSVGDGRASGLIGRVLETSGVRVVEGSVAGGADILVTDPARGALAGVRSWRARCPGGRLVLFGRPEAADARAWEALRPIVITDREDLGAIKGALGRAIAAPI